MADLESEIEQPVDALSELDKLIGGDNPSPNEAVTQHAESAEGKEQVQRDTHSSTSQVSTDGSLETNGTLEAAGVVMDSQGNTWQIPAGNVDDLDDLYAGDVYKLPKSLTDKFHVQLIPKSRLREYLARQFVPVKLTEVGIPAEMLNTSGDPLDTYHVIGDSILVKIPQVIYDRIRERKSREVHKRLAEMEPTKEMQERSKNSGIMVKVERERSITRANPDARMGIGLEEK